MLNCFPINFYVKGYEEKRNSDTLSGIPASRPNIHLYQNKYTRASLRNLLVAQPQAHKSLDGPAETRHLRQRQQQSSTDTEALPVEILLHPSVNKIIPAAVRNVRNWRVVMLRLSKTFFFFFHSLPTHWGLTSDLLRLETWQLEIIYKYFQLNRRLVDRRLRCHLINFFFQYVKWTRRHLADIWPATRK